MKPKDAHALKPLAVGDELIDMRQDRGEQRWRVAEVSEGGERASILGLVDGVKRPRVVLEPVDEPRRITVSAGEDGVLEGLWLAPELCR